MRQVRGSRGHISHLQDQVRREFLLDSEAPLLDARSFQIWVDGELRWRPDGLSGALENLVHDRIRPFADVLHRNPRAPPEIEPALGIHRSIEHACSSTE